MRRIVVAVPVGVAGGLLSAAFLESLSWTERTRGAHDSLVWTLPLAGLAVGLAYHLAGSAVSGGNSLLFDQADSPTTGVPFRLAPLVFVASVVSHISGASVGREGAALQMTAGVVEPWGRRLRWTTQDRAALVVSAIAAGFGSIVGAPIAGAIFALEVRRSGASRRTHALSALVASWVGVEVVDRLGVERTPFPAFPDVIIDIEFAVRVLASSVACGVVAIAFVVSTRTLRALISRLVVVAPLRPMLGGIVVAVMVMVLDLRDFQGLSLHLALDAQTGEVVGQWWWKFVLTVVSVGTGFVGGEVVPLVVIGSLVGGAIGNIAGQDTAVLAILGGVAMLAGGAKAPLACTVLGAELFGWSGIVFFAVASLVARAVSGRTSIYSPAVPLAVSPPSASTN